MFFNCIPLLNNALPWIHIRILRMGWKGRKEEENFSFFFASWLFACENQQIECISVDTLTHCVIPTIPNCQTLQPQTSLLPSKTIFRFVDFIVLNQQLNESGKNESTKMCQMCVMSFENYTKTHSNKNTQTLSFRSFSVCFAPIQRESFSHIYEFMTFCFLEELKLYLYYARQKLSNSISFFVFTLKFAELFGGKTAALCAAFFA